MTVKDLLAAADREDIAGRMAERYGNGRDAARKYISAAYAHMLEIEPAAMEDNLLVCAEVMEEYLSVCIYRKKDLKKAETFGRGEEEIPVYTVESFSWPELLGSDMAMTSAALYGGQACALAVFKEMTYFGFGEESRDTGIQKLEEVWKELGTESGVPELRDSEKWRAVFGENQKAVHDILEREKEALKLADSIEDS